MLWLQETLVHQEWHDPCCTGCLACQTRSSLRGWSVLIICSACWLLITTQRLYYPSLFSVAFIFSSPFLFFHLILCFFSACSFLSRLFSPHSTSFTCFLFCSFQLLNSVGTVFFLPCPFLHPPVFQHTILWSHSDQIKTASTLSAEFTKCVGRSSN